MPPRPSYGTWRKHVPKRRSDDVHPDVTDILQGLEPTPLEAIPVPRSAQHDPNVVISHTKYLGSYEWTARSIPTIIIPGTVPQPFLKYSMSWLPKGVPNRWCDKTPFQVDRDTGICIVDQNTHRMAEAPLLPLMVAVDANEDADMFKWSAVDYVTDRNAIRKILRWVGGDDVRDFRIDLQRAGRKTVMMCRWDNKTTEPFVGFTYGFNYFNKSTQKAHPEGTGHHRIINYVCGLTFVTCGRTKLVKGNEWIEYGC